VHLTRAPHAQRFVDTPKPIPTSFAREAFFAVTAFTFTNAEGVSRHGRFRIRPDAGTAYLSNADASAQSADFLVDEIGPQLAKEPVKLGVFVQMAGPDDDVADASVPWPDSRPEIPFGTITLTARVDDQVPERRRIIFDPVPRLDGIEASGDPLTDVRSDIYRLSGRRRREALRDARAVRPADVTETQVWRPNVGIAALGNDHFSPKEKRMSHARLQGTALITGASRGIGAVLSRVSKGLPPAASTARRRPPSGGSCEPGPWS
jgi:hypothetical protein